MYVRIKRSGSGERKHEYLQMVRSYRDEGRVCQEVMLALSRRDELVASGMLDNIIQGLANTASACAWWRSPSPWRPAPRRYGDRRWSSVGCGMSRGCPRS